MLNNLLEIINWEELGDALWDVFFYGGPIIFLLMFFLFIRAIWTFFIPFFVRTIAKSQKQIVEVERDRIELEHDRLEIEKERLRTERQILKVQEELLEIQKRANN